MKKLNIYTYFDYRRFLKDYYESAKKEHAYFSYRYFSAKVGVKAPNYLQWLIEGKRNLSTKLIPKVSKALGLDQKQHRYFKNLVQFNQSKTIKQKTAYFLKLAALREPVKVSRVTETQFEHYRAWYNNAIRELLGFHAFNPREKWAYRNLGRKLNPAITESQARRAIKQLLALGLAEQGKDGIIRQKERKISTGDEVNSFLVRKFHESMIALAGESMDRVPKKQRDISSLTMSVSENCYSLIKKEVQQFRKRIMDLVTIDKGADRVYQLNFQLFPLTNLKKTENKDHENPI